MSAPSISDQAIYERPAELLQNLIRFDTTNPPGNEVQCVSYINSLLSAAQTSHCHRMSRQNLIESLK